jgi:hypothetical protein
MKLLWYDSQNRACFIGLVERLGSEITIEEGNGERRKRVKKDRKVMTTIFLMQFLHLL